MAGLINIGFGNYVNGNGLISIVSPDAAPIRRLIGVFREKQKCIDATQGRKTKSVLIMSSDYIVLSALTPDTIAKRFHGAGRPGRSDAVEEETDPASCGADDDIILI